MVVLHYTAMATAAAALERLCSTEHEVSAHYLICERGTVYRLVDETMRAWHAGAGAWGDVTDVNSHSVGIELANNGRTPFAAAQMDALEVLLGDIMTRWNIRADRVIGHSDMAPDRKSDPGARFDWRRLALSGLSVWPEGDDVSLSRAEFEAALSDFGYPEGAFEQRLNAFRLRFRPWAVGDYDEADGVASASLAASLAHMPRILVLGESGGHSFEFGKEVIPIVRDAIRHRYGEASGDPFLVGTVYSFGGCEFTYQSEWEDPCLISSSQQGSDILVQLCKDVRAALRTRGNE